jgi:hypothetical protein
MLTADRIQKSRTYGTKIVPLVGCCSLCANKGKGVFEDLKGYHSQSCAIYYESLGVGLEY